MKDDRLYLLHILDCISRIDLPLRMARLEAALVSVRLLAAGVRESARG